MKSAFHNLVFSSRSMVSGTLNESRLAQCKIHINGQSEAAELFNKQAANNKGVIYACTKLISEKYSWAVAGSDLSLFLDQPAT